MNTDESKVFRISRDGENLIFFGNYNMASKYGVVSDDLTRIPEWAIRDAKEAPGRLISTWLVKN